MSTVSDAAQREGHDRLQYDCGTRRTSRTKSCGTRTRQLLAPYARLQGRGSAPGEEIIALTEAGVQLWSKQGFTKDQQTCTSHGAMDWSAQIKTRQKQGPVGDTGRGGGMPAAGTCCRQHRCTSLCRSALLILNLVMPTPRVLPISPRCSHCTVILSEQPQRESAVHWSKACSSVWHARMGCGHHQHGLSGTAKGCQHRQRAPFSCQSLRGWIWGILDPPSGLPGWGIAG